MLVDYSTLSASLIAQVSLDKYIAFVDTRDNEVMA